MEEPIRLHDEVESEDHILASQKGYDVFSLNLGVVFLKCDMNEKRLTCVIVLHLAAFNVFSLRRILWSVQPRI